MRALPFVLLLPLLAAFTFRLTTAVEDSAFIVGGNGATKEALGVETLGGVFTPIIKQGTPVPCSVSEMFSTSTDGQSAMPPRSRTNFED